MPVRSLRSPVIRWPDRRQVETALREWAATQARSHPEIRRIGYFGSFARGDWGVGSDLDVIVILNDEPPPPRFEQRAVSWDLTTLPVPADLLVYSQGEWEALMKRPNRFARMLRDETVWVT
jgi:uncharacterized protein